MKQTYLLRDCVIIIIISTHYEHYSMGADPEVIAYLHAHHFFY